VGCSLAERVDTDADAATEAEGATMSSAPLAVTPTGREERTMRAWWESTQVWAGLATVSMWMAVLFDGVFGADLTSTTNNASTNTTTTTVPSVIAVAICALLATIAIAHAAFRRAA
jgi:hypothetical protein